MTIPENYIQLLTAFPFLTIVNSGRNEFVGIMQNQDVAVSSIYVYALLNSPAEKRGFLDLGSEWWWETNRKIPINIILGERFTPYKYSLMNFSNKDFEIIAGPTLSLKDLMTKRVKRKSVQLIRRLD
jgi:hypothetical protein